NGVPIHSFADAQFALDIAPATGSIDIAWQRDNRIVTNKLALFDGWRKTDISWRPSMQRVVGSIRLYGRDLTPEEKKTLGLASQQLAFRQQYPVSSQAQAAGIRTGDIIVGVDDKQLEMDVTKFLGYVQRNYLVGDRLTVNIVRDGQRMNLPMNLLR